MRWFFTAFNDFIHLLFPKICACCDHQLMPTEVSICTYCRTELPLTKDELVDENQTKRVFYGRISIEKASSLLFYEKGGIVQNLLHDLKYKGNQEVGKTLGTWHANLLKLQGWDKEIDYIIPVPVHKNRLKKRGYNQVDSYARAIAKVLNATFYNDLLLRKGELRTQVFKNRVARSKVRKDDFYLSNNYNQDKFYKKHILLVDDIITTGATLEACSRQLLKFTNCKLSLVTIACAK